MSKLHQDLKSINDEQLMLCVGEGNRDALAELYQRFRVPLFAFLKASASNRELASDHLQDVFLRAWRYRETFHRGSVRAWLYRIARNVRADHLERSSRRELQRGEMELMATPLAESTPHQRLAASERLAAVERALGKLPELDREALLLARLGELRYRELGQVLSCSEGAARVRVSRALKKLSKLVEQDDRGGQHVA